MSLSERRLLMVVGWSLQVEAARRTAGSCSLIARVYYSGTKMYWTRVWSEDTV